MASASETGEEDYQERDDSDMYMEPDGAETGHLSNETSQLTEQVQEKTDSQNFFPSFTDLFTNPRYDQQSRFRSNRFFNYFQRDRPTYQASATTTIKDIGASQHAILGSGNFGVIRGGTYYPEDKETDEYGSDESPYNSYYHNNVRPRSNYYRNPKPIRGGDLFANFRDFADITAPPKSSFSHLSVVYANRNSTGHNDKITEPRNIIETLRMLEEEEDVGDVVRITTSTELPTKKLSKGKRKLIEMRKYEENKARRTILTPAEPLLALS